MLGLVLSHLRSPLALALPPSTTSRMPILREDKEQAGFPMKQEAGGRVSKKATAEETQSGGSREGTVLAAGEQYERPADFTTLTSISGQRYGVRVCRSAVSRRFQEPVSQVLCASSAPCAGRVQAVCRPCAVLLC